MSLRIHATVLIVALAAIVSGGSHAADDKAPAPKAEPVDLFAYSRTPVKEGKGSFLLSVSRDGKITYSHQSAPFTGSGGVVVSRQWEIPKKDAAALLDGLIEDGLLKIKRPDAKGGELWSYRVEASSGRKQVLLSSAELPEKMFDRLLPLLRQAHPAEWGAEPKK